MPHPMLRRATPGIIAALVAITAGIAGGTAATSGLRLNSYGIDAPPPKPVAEIADDGDLQPSLAGCAGCSERALGYRWATARSIRSAVDCPQDSWNFERGCRDYVSDPAI